MIQSGNRRALLGLAPTEGATSGKMDCKRSCVLLEESVRFCPSLRSSAAWPRRGAGHYFASAVVPGTLFRGPLPRPRRRKETPLAAAAGGEAEHSWRGSAPAAGSWALRRPWGLSVWCVVSARVHVDLQSGCETERPGEG